MRYAVVIETAGDNYSAYVPDLPGCVATGSTHAENGILRFGRRSNSISRECARTGLQYPHPLAGSNMSRSPRRGSSTFRMGGVCIRSTGWHVGHRVLVFDSRKEQICVLASRRHSE